MVKKCLFCGKEFDCDPAVPRFCDRCSCKLVLVGVDLDDAEAKLESIELSKRIQATPNGRKHEG